MKITLAKILDQIIVIDIESTCWEGKIPEEQESEIIEIGICPLDIKTGDVTGRTCIFIKPERSEVSEFCTKLTGITKERVEKGTSFEEACLDLQENYLTKKRTWASWGDYDRNMFQKQCKSFGVKYPFGHSHINVKNLFAVILKLKHEVGMDKALEILNLPLEGSHHRGKYDAWNIANILSHLIHNCQMKDVTL